MPTYRLSQPQGLESVGPDFMREVFKLKQGDVAALPNYDKSIVYVVRLADQVETDEQLRSNFLEQANFWPGRYIMRNNSAQSERNAAMSAMLENINVEWKRDDAQAADEESDDS
jgi:hypothetical protein